MRKAVTNKRSNESGIAMAVKNSGKGGKRKATSSPVDESVASVVIASSLAVKAAVASKPTIAETLAVKATVDETTGILLEIKNMTDKEIGVNFRDLRVEEQVRRFTKTKLFHWLKFIVVKSELGRLDGPHDIGNVVMRGLNVNDKSKMPRWWLLYQSVVKRALDTQRSNCNMAIKSVMTCKCNLLTLNQNYFNSPVTNLILQLFVAAIRLGRLPDLEDILGGRKAAMDNIKTCNIENSAYFYFFDKIVECVAGKKEWKAQKAKVLINKSCVTVSDEAFALLLMVNSWDKFEYLGENPEIDDKNDIPETLYTEKKGRNKAMQGWSRQGIDKFNILCDLVVKDRSGSQGPKFDAAFMKYHELKLLAERGGQEEGSDVEEDEDNGVNGTINAFHQLQDMENNSGGPDGALEISTGEMV
jgi:hypothetical protein